MCRIQGQIVEILGQERRWEACYVAAFIEHRFLRQWSIPIVQAEPEANRYIVDSYRAWLETDEYPISRIAGAERSDCIGIDRDACYLRVRTHNTST